VRYGVDVAVTVALRGAAVGGLVGSLIRLQFRRDSSLSRCVGYGIVGAVLAL
jgi:hypothetical protein